MTGPVRNTNKSTKGAGGRKQGGGGIQGREGPKDSGRHRKGGEGVVKGEEYQPGHSEEKGIWNRRENQKNGRWEGRDDYKARGWTSLVKKCGERKGTTKHVYTPGGQRRSKTYEGRT